jgi:hypothetical protein
MDQLILNGLSESDHQALHRLVIELAWRIDHHKGHTIHELFTEDAEMGELGAPFRMHVVGRAEIEAWGKERLDRAAHVYTNLRFEADGADRAVGNAFLTVYWDPTIDVGLGITTPRMVGEITYRCVRTEEGWRFASTVCEWYCTRSDVEGSATDEAAAILAAKGK